MQTSLIKYFGGKGNGLGLKILQLFPPQSKYDIFLEPFAGAANVLLSKPAHGIEIYNDLEQNVYSLFKVLSNKELFHKFKDLCDLTYYSRDIRQEFKNDLAEKDLSLLERAYRFFYVNRTSVNGIGGISVTAECIRRNMSKSVSDYLSAIDGLPEIHDRLSRVIIENSDGIELIKKYDRDRAMIYADPPYSLDTRGPTRYKVDMDLTQQTQFIDVALNLKKAKILISGYDCKEYNRLVKAGFEQIEIRVKTQDGNRRPKNKVEYLWRNYKTQSETTKQTLWE
jgi:DNA adenine methylase